MNYICVNAACKMSATCAHAIEYNKVAERQEAIIAVASSLGHDFPSDAWDKVEEVME